MARTRVPSEEAAPQAATAVAAEPLPPDKPAAVAGAKLPKVDTPTVTPEAFFKYVAALTEDHWPHVMVYVYRILPRILREPKYIDCKSEPFDQEYMLRTFGTGKYQIRLNDTDRDVTHLQTFVTIDDPRYPPQIILQELDVAHKDNRVFVDHLKRTGKLNMDGSVKEMQQGNDGSVAMLTKALIDLTKERSPDKGLEAQAMPKVLEMLSKAGDKAVEMALSNVKQNDPEQFLKIISAVKGLMPEPDSGGNTKMMELLLKTQSEASAQVAAANQQTMTLMLKMFEKQSAPATPPADPLRDKLLDFALGKFMGGDEGSFRKPSIGEQVIEVIKDPGIQQAAVSIVTTLAQLSRGRPPAPPVQVPAELQPVLPEGQTALSAEDQQKAARLQQIYRQTVEGLSNPVVHPMIINWYLEPNAYAMGEATWALDGGKSYGEMCELGPEGLVSVMQRIPPLWNVFSTNVPEAVNFFSDFITAYAEIKDGKTGRGAVDIEEELPEEAPAPGKKRKEKVQ